MIIQWIRMSGYQSHSVCDISVCLQRLNHTLISPPLFILVLAGEEVHCSLVCEVSMSCRLNTSLSSTKLVSSVPLCLPLSTYTAPKSLPLAHSHIVIQTFNRNTQHTTRTRHRQTNLLP